MDSEHTMEARKVSSRAASRLKQERERRAWTQSEVAERLGTTQINVSRWENGSTFPGPYYRQRLGELFGKSMEELGFLEEEKRMEPMESPPLEVADPIMPSPRLPVSNLPHRRNPFFTGRQDILARLATAFRHKPRGGLIQALTGLGGIGKTQIAVEYAYQSSGSYDTLFWVTASTRDTLNVGFATLARLLDLPIYQTQDQGLIVQAVKRWLETHSHWLLILDSVDHPELLTDFFAARASGRYSAYNAAAGVRDTRARNRSRKDGA